MCANASSTSSLSPVTSTRRSLLSRLTSPLRSRTRNLSEFFVRLGDPHRTYFPGDVVKGAVVLTVVKPIRITHLTVCLHGFVRVFKHANGVNDPLPADAGLSAGSNPRKTQYFGNGHASLFQDEITLCGEGRLEPGVYEFNFELEFPRKGLPTSIDFERGTISYMITSTLTRPTSIAATSTCDQKVALVETVDIGPMNPPKPRTISLEPISRRTRRVKVFKNKENGSQDTTDISSGSEMARKSGSPLPDESASQRGGDQDTLPRSPIPSDVQSSISATNSADSFTSSTSFRITGGNDSTRSMKDGQNIGSRVSLANKTITATIELLKAGCLPGETLPLKISIKHTKAIKSMHGIIITLYRQGRIDSAPPLSLFMDIKGKEAERLKHEEYYPKSKTGLSGLSLTSAGSSSLFRKDLAQTFAPILVDPSSLTSIVNASVRVPEDVFPTISGVPGQMISFKYYIEVVVDLGGKLAGQERHLPRVGTLSLPSSFANSNSRPDGNPNLLAAWGGSIVDTDHIRREKSVVACLFEIVVGTTNSARKRTRGSSTVKQPADDVYEQQPTTPLPVHEPIYEESSVPPNGHEPQYGHYPPYPYYDEHYQEYYPHDGYDYQGRYTEQYPSTQTEIHVPPPDIPAENELSEKERVRRAEQRLLPSQPPIGDGQPSSSAPLVPSATTPAPPESHDDLYSPDDNTPRVIPSMNRALSHDSAATPIALSSASPLGLLPSAPPLEEVELNNNSVTHPADDKQELERRRMLAEASAPPDFGPDGEQDNAGEGSSVQQPSQQQDDPSAPIIVDEDRYGGQYAHQQHMDMGIAHMNIGPALHNESLPKYER